MVFVIEADSQVGSVFSVVRESEWAQRWGKGLDLTISYCGAPYFSSMGALRFGADLAHVICEPSAGAAIKT
jgi:NAD(P)H-hydrate repair Nnr-like enzyme with NAD(P)H-hydrate dehydratase domain